jgi:hypothetical protein
MLKLRQLLEMLNQLKLMLSELLLNTKTLWKSTNKLLMLKPRLIELNNLNKRNVRGEKHVEKLKKNKEK